jgi:hypothetical protein
MRLTISCIRKLVFVVVCFSLFYMYMDLFTRCVGSLCVAYDYFLHKQGRLWEFFHILLPEGLIFGLPKSSQLQSAAFFATQPLSLLP